MTDNGHGALKNDPTDNGSESHTNDNRLTVRTTQGDVGGDTVLFRDESLLVVGTGESESIPLTDVESVIAGEPVETTTAVGGASA